VGHAAPPPPAGDLSVAAWRERAPRLASECASAWELTLGAPFEEPAFSYVAPAVRADGTATVLKLTFPDAESEHEAAALAHWDGAGAVRLLAHNPDRRALLIERCVPGTALWDVADEEEANAAAAAVLRALWRPPPARHDIRPLAGEARRWAAELPGRFARHGAPFDRAVLDRAVGWIEELLGAPDGDPVVLHQDFHGGNVLRAERERWLAIDPKPLVGERAFDAASLLRDRRPDLAGEAHPVRRMRRRLDQLSEALALDRERMRRWAVVHALAWGLGGREDDERFDAILACAVWLDRA
jgi:streptomycin 6-kinase